MADDPPNELRAALAEGRALLVCGAGISMAATSGAATGWAWLIREGLAEATKLNAAAGKRWVASCELLLASDEVDDWLDAANTIQTKLGGSSAGPWRAFFKQRLGGLRVTNPAILDALKRLADAGNRIATTNYDHLISRALHWDRADWTNHVRVIEALRRDPPAVWHIHGDWDHPESIVFSQADYHRIVAKELPQFVQQTATLGFTLVFVGCSGSGLSDDNVGRLMDWLHKGFSGLGDKHFALTTDDNKDTWPAGVIPVRVGARDDLAAYLKKLAPASRPAVSFPPDPRMIGREDRLKELVEAIRAQERPILVPGALGMGKTTLALAAAYDPEVVKYFGRDRRFFVNLEPVPDADSVVRALASTLGLDASGALAGLEQAITDACAAQPALVILDNLETPWRNETAATEAALGRLAGIAGLHLIVTMRGEMPQIPGGGVMLGDVESLGFDEARKLFLRHAGPKHGSDPALPGLLQALDGHPLSIELLAANAAGKADLKDLAADWKSRRPEMFKRAGGDTRLTSLFVSLQISMDALGANSPAHRLVRAMALLPAGMAEGDCEATLSDGAPTEAEKAAARKLEKARLATRRDGRWRLLAPVREALLHDNPPEEPDHARLVTLFLTRISRARELGKTDWDFVRPTFEAEAGNFDAIVGFAAGDPLLLKGLDAAVWGLAQFHRFTGLGSVTSIPRAASSLGRAGNKGEEANCRFSLAIIALQRSDHSTALAQSEAALQLYRKVGHTLGEANCIRVLGSIALARSEYETAQAKFEAALPLSREAGDALGEANCIESIGDIAFARSDNASAHAQFEAALRLNRKIGAVLGEANCIKSLGSIAHARSDHASAREQYNAALTLYRRIGAVQGEAMCIRSLADIARARSEHDYAAEQYHNALLLFRKIGAVQGEANCTEGLGDIAKAHSDNGFAYTQYDAALTLYRKIGDVRGEANCIHSLGEIAFESIKYEVALTHFEAALLLDRKNDNMLGEANSLRRLGDIALCHFEEPAARARYEAALPLYRKVGDIVGEANCIKGLGDIALVSSDHKSARGPFLEALPLYRKISDVLGEANCIQGLGDIREALGNIVTARRLWNGALALYAGIPEYCSIGSAHLRLLRRAPTPAEGEAHREAARRAWASIDRADLIAKYLDGAP